MYARQVKILKEHSFFLFGPRGTGKSTFLSGFFSSKEAYSIDLLKTANVAVLQARPDELERLALGSGKRWIVIDEVQKVPALLDVVHRMIEQHGLFFALTGSSARKLKRGAANLLAGRAFTHRLFPLTVTELGSAFDLDVALQWGTLPKVVTLASDQSRSRFLQAYAETYLQEEIVAEQVVRSLPPFRRFLQVAAQSNAAIVNFKKVADDCQTSPSNVRNYYQILEDTLVGVFLEPFQQSIRKRQRESPKFYWFDTGVVRALRLSLDATMERATYEYGKLFETFIVNQVRSALDYHGKQYQLSYLLTKDGAEVDLIVERAGEPTLLLEIKSGPTVRDAELVNLRAFHADIKKSQAICLYTGSERLLSQGIPVLPWIEGLKELGLC
jgi:predicted AAA+ superfamily ATPase